MMNSAKAKYKFSKLEVNTNKTILIILLMQCLFSMIAGGIGSSWIQNNGVTVVDSNVCKRFTDFKCQKAYYLEFGKTSSNYFDTSDSTA